MLSVLFKILVLFNIFINYSNIIIVITWYFNQLYLFNVLDYFILCFKIYFWKISFYKLFLFNFACDFELTLALYVKLHSN